MPIRTIDRGIDASYAEYSSRPGAQEWQTRFTDEAACHAEVCDRSPIEISRTRNPVEFLERSFDALAQPGAELKKLADAAAASSDFGPTSEPH